MARRGTYALTTKTISQIVGTQDTMVRISATLSPWLPAQLTALAPAPACTPAAVGGGRRSLGLRARQHRRDLCWLWVANHNLDFSVRAELLGGLWTRLGGLTGLLGAFLALVQVLLLARLPLLGRTIGFDRLTVWHRWNGYLVPPLSLAHTVLAVLRAARWTSTRRSSTSSGRSSRTASCRAW